MPRNSEFAPRKTFGSLQGCLVGGDPEQQIREQRVRRKALASSILLQASLVAALVLVPLFAKPARLITPIMTPIPPYRHASGQTHTTQPPRGHETNICVTCFNSHPANPPTNDRRQVSNLEQPVEELGPGDGVPTVPCPSCIDIPTAGPRAPVSEGPRETRRVARARIDPAMLIHRVEPVYPTLARQIGRAGRVELRAVIATDGTIQALQAVSGDPLFYQSALEAVRQWRYKPTVLNGEPVEIDTFITVIYSMNR